MADQRDTTQDARDAVVVMKALAYAAVAIEALPARWQEASDAADMRRLLKAMTGRWPGGEEFFLDEARRHLDRGE